MMVKHYYFSRFKKNFSPPPFFMVLNWWMQILQLNLVSLISTHKVDIENINSI